LDVSAARGGEGIGCERGNAGGGTVKPEDASPSTSAAGRCKPVVTIQIGAARVVVPTGVDRATLKVVLELLGEHQVRVTR